MNREESITLERFLSLLQAARLLGADDLARVERQATREDFHEPGVLAWWMIEQDLATRWQAHMLVSGWNHFFLAKYKLLDRVGAGGMGTVYKAWQPGLSRVVALKVLSDALLGDEQAVARFHREIQSVAALEHPNIVATFDADCVKGKHFLVMEYVEGQDLDAMARKRGRIPAAEACEYARQAALGLAHAHERGMVHRDIKPANLLVTFRSVNETVVPIVKILDFGLARFGAEIQGAAELTQTGQVMGTPDYIAPEQARDTRSADHRSDIFSLGCTLFRLVTGQVPYRGSSVMEKLMARALDEAPRARSICPDLHPDLDICIARMLARDSAMRFQTAAELALVLDSFTSTSLLPAVPGVSAGGKKSFASVQADSAAADSFDRFGPLAAPDTEMAQFLAVLAQEANVDRGSICEAAESTHVALASQAAGVTRVDRPRKTLSPVVRASRAGGQGSKASGRGRIAQYIALAVSAVALAGLGGFILWQLSASTQLVIDWPDDERKGATLEVDGRERTPVGKLSISGGAGVRKLRLTRKGYQPIEQEFTLARGATVTFQPEWVPTPVTARRRELASLKSEVERIKSASGGRFPAANDPSRAALQSQLDDFRRKWLMTPEALQADAIFRSLPAPADQLSQATIPGYELRLSGVDRVAGNGTVGNDPGGAPAELVAVIGDSRLKHSGMIWSIAYSPDESLLVAGDELGYLKIWDPETGQVISSFKAHENAIYSLAFSPDGKTLLTGSVDELAKLWNVGTMQLRQTLSGHTSQLRAVAYSSLGDLVATAGLDQTLRLWDPANGKLVRSIEGIAGHVGCLAFSPDGQVLAVGCHDPFDAYLFDVTKGKLRHRLEGHHQVVYSLAFSPDGKRLVTGSADASITCWDSLSGKEIRSMEMGNRTGVAAVRFCPDGRTVAAGLGNGTVEFWDVNSGEFQKSLRADDAGVMTLALSRSGKRLTTAGGSQTVRIWDLENGAEAVSPGLRILCAAASPDGRWLALGVRDGVIDLWDVAAQKKTASLQGTSRRVASLAYSPDGAWLASAGDYGESTVRIWDVAAKELLHIVNVQQGYVHSVAFSPDANAFASAGDDGTVKLWNSQTAALEATLDGKVGPAHCLTFSHDGCTLVTGHLRHQAGSVVKVWDVVRQREQKTVDVQAGQIAWLGFGRDEKYVTTGCPAQGVTLWDIARGSERMNFSGSGPFAYSPDASLLAVDDKSAIHVYGTAHGDRTAELSLGRPDLRATQLVFTSEGRHVAALASNGTVHVLRLPLPTD
jgi:WD40 repeat protein/serine/threonine protein kinase